jgi:hypothetical protein
MEKAGENDWSLLCVLAEADEDVLQSVLMIAIRLLRNPDQGPDFAALKHWLASKIHLHHFGGLTATPCILARRRLTSPPV